MKKVLNACTIGLAANLGIGVFSDFVNLEVSATVQIHGAVDFYEPLAAQGAWVEIGSYGRCWLLAQVAVEWRPYCYGSWVCTDCGWYWESDEPWAWACYHYGNWVYDPAYAWIWVPGIEWAPAWVCWRMGGGYVGWAPLPPRGGFVFRSAVAVPAPFVFVEMTRFHERVSPSSVTINNTTIINKTTQINNIRQETRNIGGGASQKVIVNEGPGLETIQKATAKKVRVASIQEVVRQTTVPPAVRHKANEAHKNVERPTAAQPGGRELPRDHQEKAAQSPKGDPAPKHEQAPKVEHFPRGEVRPSPARPPTPPAPPLPPQHPARESAER